MESYTKSLFHAGTPDPLTPGTRLYDKGPLGLLDFVLRSTRYNLLVEAKTKTP